MGFGDAVALMSKKMLDEVNSSAISIATEVFTEVVKKTPVGRSKTKGQLINNWFVAEGAGIINTSYTYVFNTTGMNSYTQISTIRKSKEFASKDGEVSFTNSTPYGFRAEYFGWPLPEWSGTVKPYAMIRNSLMLVAAKYK